MILAPKADVLVADDEVENVQALMAILEGQGYSVRVALSGPAVLDAARARRPDLLLLDVNMPGMDGYQVCTAWQADPDLREIPVVFLSGHAGLQEKLRAFEVGGVDYVTKPVQYQEVVARVRTHLTIGRQRRRLDHLAECLAQRNLELEKLNRQLEEMSMLDGLTQVSNRRAFEEYLSHEWTRALREKTPIALLMCDLDHFKELNDSSGHQAGDKALVRVAHLMRLAAHRPADMAARYGGEEFAVVLPNTPLEGAVEVACEIREMLASARIPNRGAPDGWLTVSIGAACRVPEPEASPQSLVLAADRALYSAKREGRDRVGTDGATIHSYRAG